MSAGAAPPVRTRTVLLFTASGVFAVFFVVWTLFSAGQGSVFEFDRRCAQYWKEHGVGASWNLMVFMTDIGGIAALSMMAIMAGVWQFSHGRRVFGTIWFGIVIGGAIANLMLKTNLDRPRPEQALRDRAVLEENESYPSGHTMGSAVGYGMLCYALLRQTRFPLRRTVITLFFVVFVTGIGFSRIYLRAHWFSDVIGGYAAGLCWLCFWLGWVERRRVRIASVRPAPQPHSP